MSLEKGHKSSIDGKWIIENETKEFNEGLYEPKRKNNDDIGAQMLEQSKAIANVLAEINIDAPKLRRNKRHYTN